MNLQALIGSCKLRNRQAQYELYDLYKARLMGVCRRYTRSREEAQDILQEVFYKIFTKIDQVESDEKLEAWMMRVAVHTAINHYRANVKKSNTVKIEEYDHVVNNEEIIISDLSNDVILGHINSLPDGARLIFNMYAIEGYNHVEISKMLGITVGTSKSQFYYAKVLLKLKLKKTGITGITFHEKYA
jgi:RNA polymerase sigma factor (sigma-70 family)